MLAIILAIAASTAAGVWAEHRFRGRAGRGSRRALMVVLYVVLPPVTFFNLVGADLGGAAGLGILFGLVSLSALGLVAWTLGTRVLRLPRPATGALICCELVVNTGYLGLAVVAALRGFDALGEAVAYDVLVSGPALLVGAFAVGAAFGARGGEGPRERLVAFLTRNPPLYAAIAALVAPASFAPNLLVDASRVAVIALLPLGFFVVGVTLAAEAEEGALRFPPPLSRAVGVALVLKLLVAPAIMLALSQVVLSVPDPYLVQAAMASAINAIVIAHEYGLDRGLAAGAIAWSTAIVVVAGLVVALVR